MFYLYVRIYSRNQLNQLEPDFMSSLNGQISAINQKYGGVTLNGKDGLFRYAALYRETLINMINAAQACQKLLEEEKEGLDGYNIVLTGADKQDYELQKKLDFLVYQILDDGGIWVDPHWKEDLSGYLLLEKEKYLYRMTGQKEFAPTTGERFSFMLEDESAIKRIGRWLEQEDRPLLVLSGEKGAGRRLNLERALKEYFGKKSPSTIRLKLNGDRDYIYDPYRDCLGRLDVSEEEERGNPLLLDLRQGKMMSRCSDFFSRDFEEAFLEYLEEEKRKIAGRSQTLFVIVEKGEDFSSASRQLLERILERKGLRFILISEKSRPEYLSKTSNPDVILFLPPTEEKLSHKLSRAFGEGDWTSQKMAPLLLSEPLNSQTLFYSAWLCCGGITPGEGVSPVRTMIDSLNEREKRVLRYIGLSKGLIGRKEMSRFLADEEEDISLISERIDRLKSLALVDETKGGKLHAEFELPPFDKTQERQTVKDLIGLLNREGQGKPFQYFSFLEEHGETDKALEYLNNIMNWLINNGFQDRADSLISNPPFMGKEIDELSLDSLQNLLFANRLRLSLIKGDQVQLGELVANGLLSQVSERGKFADEFYLQLSRYYYCQGNADQAVDYAKKALFMFQKTGFHLGESLANIELAFAFLGQRKVQMGMDYFEIARRISYQIEDNYTLITARTFGALTAFLFGNMSKAESIIEETLELAEKNGCRRRIFFLKFLAGRIRFEYGHYREGAELFEECYELSKQIDMTEGGDTARRWVGRCLLYLEKRRDAFAWLDSEDSTREGLLFLAEADFMVSLYESALSKLEKAEAMVPNRELSYSEMDRWCDGFMPIEGRLSSNDVTEDVLSGQIDALHSYILALTGRHSEAMALFMKRGGQDDYPFKPYSYKYSYIHFTILNVGEISLSGDDNRLASLSRAIERLQSRAGRFDNQHKKLDFLNKNWWNRKIMEEAHRKKFL
ncbi:MAG: hypothetical protein PQJ59_07085 [Spirochaetales bacterium]|nr:hypothetical protein [Spirochaetales bacterium]